MPPLTHKHFLASEGCCLHFKILFVIFISSVSCEGRNLKRLRSCRRRVSTWDQEWDSCDRIFVISLFSSFGIVGDRGIRIYICERLRVCQGVTVYLLKQTGLLNFYSSQNKVRWLHRNSHLQYMIVNKECGERIIKRSFEVTTRWIMCYSAGWGLCSASPAAKLTWTHWNRKHSPCWLQQILPEDLVKVNQGWTSQVMHRLRFCSSLMSLAIFR